MYVILLAFLKGGCRSLPYRDLPLRHIHCWWWTERCTSTQADIVWCCVHEFLSTLSAWRATKVCWYRYLRQRHFYPRSPHGERLGLYSFDFTLLIDFYPRSPHGERPHHNYIIFIAYVFLSTLSAWRATSNWQRIQGVSHISIHALRMESDGCAAFSSSVISLFLSTLSAWRATYTIRLRSVVDRIFLSTLSAWRATCLISYSIYVARSVFLSTLSAWRATLQSVP